MRALLLKTGDRPFVHDIDERSPEAMLSELRTLLATNDLAVLSIANDAVLFFDPESGSLGHTEPNDRATRLIRAETGDTDALVLGNALLVGIQDGRFSDSPERLFDELELLGCFETPLEVR